MQSCFSFGGLATKLESTPFEMVPFFYQGHCAIDWGEFPREDQTWPFRFIELDPADPGGVMLNGGDT